MGGKVLEHPPASDEPQLGDVHRLRDVVIPRRRTLIGRVNESEQSIMGLLKEGSRIGGFLTQEEVQRAYSARFNQILDGIRTPEERFALAGEGNTPESRFRTRAESYAHFRRECLRSGYAISPSRRRPRGDSVRAFESRSDEIARSWLTSDILGVELHRRFRQSPPLSTVIGDSDFGMHDEITGSGLPTYPGRSAGMYLPGTNYFIVRESVAGRDEGDQASIIVHEQLHYAAWLGGGLDGMRWRDEGGHPVMGKDLRWMHEGLTELYANQITRSNGLDPGSSAYPYETAVAFYMQRLVGTDVLRQAYLSGDFTEVRRRFDGRLGAGSFDRLASMSRGWQALSFIMPRMAEANIDFTRWENDPVIAQCFEQIERFDERGGGW